MGNTVKNILVVASLNKEEALRMAAGLTLLDDTVRVLISGSLEMNDEVQLQLDSLMFAEVSVENGDVGAIGAAVAGADVVYML